MNTTETITALSGRCEGRLQDALDNLSKGIRDPEKARAGPRTHESLREENRRLFGEQNIAVELIRQAATKHELCSRFIGGLESRLTRGGSGTAPSACWTNSPMLSTPSSPRPVHAGKSPTDSSQRTPGRINAVNPSSC